MARPTVATPTEERCLTSYPARRRYNPGVVYPPEVATVSDVIDIHCHAHEQQQDALALAKYASRSGMRGILFKTIVPRDRPAASVRAVQEELERWAEKEQVEPITCWAGAMMGRPNSPVSTDYVREQLDDGVTGFWLPVFNHANTLHKIGGRPIGWKDPSDDVGPLAWDEALKVGHYLLGENGALKPEVREIVRIIADRNAALFFGHATHREIFLLAEEVDKLGFMRVVVDHPYSPFINLSIEQMKQLAAAGIFLNFTYDELSPLLGVDPAKMYAAIREVGPEHFTLSSDAGEPLLPSSVECMRLIRGYMEAFGLTKDELHGVCTRNPGVVVGLH